MVRPFDYFDHRRDCKYKQDERARRIASLPKEYTGPITPTERGILAYPISELVNHVHNGVVQPVDILRAYGKSAIAAHKKTNCLTEILFPSAENHAHVSADAKGPLAGVPVSLKDSVNVAGFDTSVGYSGYTRQPLADDGPMVRLLRDAGAVPFVKTNLPTTLLSFESSNDVWGRTRNPHNPAYSPGGSTGGESALLAAGGSRIGIGSDVAGSVRIPAHWSGCYSLRCSTGRWPKMGNRTSMPGQEGVPSVFSPMTRTLGDLRYFTKAVVGMKPWTYDHSAHPIEWREDVVEEFAAKKLRIGVMRSDGVVDPSPACARALSIAATALSDAGHSVIDIPPPPSPISPYDGLVLASQLLNSDGCATFLSFLRTGESSDPGAIQLSFWANLARPLKWLYYAYVKYVKRDAVWAELLKGFGPVSATEQWKLVISRESFRLAWHEWWEGGNGLGGMEKKVDVILTAPNATPALPHGAMKDAVSACGYTFLFNMLDYSCGILPVTHVDAELDALPVDFKLRKLNGVARGAYKHYDAKKMGGLPVAVQVVGQRLEEEKVLTVMQRLEDALESRGEKYLLLEID
ncbi:amidase signature enzyme [Eremomyces bilateralis CBS 781.70]|uniref:amidase n=1 Tax=Eremomyces bilateralis CBS 781.70 TaxID=1392243 RepID=A0A6G1GEU9_9PEZI|nr:amidase signature enzyme [Eremomyces bilateralis CBS 781.70]KAF1816588.1 amidase signature enzyme [Eremomyces bilateralis CBS 781.70]